MADIFLSYASGDRNRVAPIVQALQSQGWAVWWDRELKPGPSFDREIEKALDECRCVVVVWSQDSVESEWVRTEASEGAQRNILVPVRIDQVRPPLAFRYRQIADLSGESKAETEHQFQQFIAAVAQTLEAEPTGQASQPHGYMPKDSSKAVRRGAAIAVAAAVGLLVGYLAIVERPVTVTAPITEQPTDPDPSGAPATAERGTESSEAFDHYLTGRALLRTPGQADAYERALAAFESAIQLDPNFAQAYAGRCGTHLARYRRGRDQDDFVNAESSCFRALTLQKPGQNAWEIHTSLGALYREAGQYDKAIAELEMTNRNHPNSAEVLRQLGLTLAAAGDVAGAEQKLRAAIALEPTYWDARVALGNFLYDQTRYADAAGVHRQVLDVMPMYSGALIGLGSALYMLGDLEQAEKKWALAEKVVPEHERGSLAMVHSNVGIGDYYEGDFQQAIAQQLEASELDPDDHRFLGRLAESYRAADQPELAQQAYKKAIGLAEKQLRLNPNDWETLGLLGLYHGFTNDSKKAREFADRMLATDDANPTAHYFDALVKWSGGDVEGTFESLDSAIKQGFSKEMIRQDPDIKRLRPRDPARYDALLAD